MTHLIRKPLEPFSVYGYRQGDSRLYTHEDLLGHWSVLFFYPADFTFVCPTELKDLSEQYDRFAAEDCEIFSVSMDSHYVHKAWADASETIRAIQYPMLADPAGVLARQFGVLLEEEGQTLRATFVLDPEDRLYYLMIVGACLVMQVLLLLPLFFLSKGQRLELDREGVHLRFDHRKGKDLYWADVQDWGFGYTVSKYGKSYFLYFSPVKLTAAGTDNKKFFGVKGLLSVQVGKQDYLTLSRSGFLAFCRGHLGDGDGMTDRYVPMFCSDIREGLYED